MWNSKSELHVDSHGEVHMELELELHNGGVAGGDVFFRLALEVFAGNELLPEDVLGRPHLRSGLLVGLHSGSQLRDGALLGLELSVELRDLGHQPNVPRAEALNVGLRHVAKPRDAPTRQRGISPSVVHKNER